MTLSLYRALKDLLEKGYSVELTPVKRDSVKLTVQQARQGRVKAVEVEMINMEWQLAEAGIAERLREALAKLTSPNFEADLPKNHRKRA